MELARLRHISVDPMFTELRGSQLEQIDQVDAVYRTVIDKTGALTAKPDNGPSLSPDVPDKLEKKSLWPLLSLETILGWIFFPIAF